MKAREDISISQIFNRLDNFNISSGRTLENTSRPISAIIKRPDSKTKLNGMSNNVVRNSHFPSVITEINAKKLNYSSSKHKSNSIILEKERLYEDAIHLKNHINDLKKEIANLKSENHKNMLEINKKNKIIEDIFLDSQNNMFGNNPLNDSKLSKAKETLLLIQIKKQYKELKNEYKAKCVELETFKKNLKLTKINEIGIELKTYMEELARIKSLYLITSQQNEINEKKLKDFDGLHQIYTQQQYILVSMQENLNKFDKETKIKNEEIINLKDKLNEKNEKIKKLSVEIKLINQINEKITKEKKNANDSIAKNKLLEKNIAELNKEIAYYKDLAEKRDKRYREIESSLKHLNDKNRMNNGEVNLLNIDSIKNIQENPEEKIDKTIMILRSKLNEANSNYDKLSKKSKILEERLMQYENQYEIQDNYITDYFNQNGYTSINEFSYVLIKNFEAKKLDALNAFNNIFAKINQNKDSLTINEILELLFNNFVSVLQIKNENDILSIEQYLKILFVSANNDWYLTEKRIVDIFSSIKIYSEKEEKILNKKLNKYLKRNQEYFNEALEKNDPNKTGFIKFLDFKKILENPNIKIKDKYIEYLIYSMKCFQNDNSCIDDLKYTVILELIKEKVNDKSNNKEKGAEQASNNNSSENEEEDDDSEIVITSEQFKMRLKTIFLKLNEYLKKNKLSVREFLRGKIFRPALENPPIECHEDAIFLKTFVEQLKSINVSLDTIDMYCIFTRLKIVDDSEAISVNYLEYELKNLENGNEITDADNSSNNFIANNETNNKYTDVKIDEVKAAKVANNIEINKIQEKDSNDFNINIENNKDAKGHIKNEIPLNDSESDKESLEEFDETDSKIESSSKNNSSVEEKIKKNELKQSMEEKYSKKLSERVSEVDEKEEEEEESYANYAFDNLANYSIENQAITSDGINKKISKENEEIEDFTIKKKSKKLDSGEEKAEKSKVTRPMSARYKTGDNK